MSPPCPDQQNTPVPQQILTLSVQGLCVIPSLVLGQKEPRNCLLERLFAASSFSFFAEVLAAGALLAALASGV